MRYSEQIETINRFRKSPPIDVWGLARALGVPVHRAFLGKDVSGMLERTKDGYKISVNAFDPETRQRFTVAHELGHYILHRDLIGEGVDDDRAYRSTEVGKYHNTAIGPAEETEANKFAANVLMPYETIERLRADGRSSPAALARALNVSEHAMHIRLGIPYEPR